jgi:hypothetical protein
MSGPNESDGQPGSAGDRESVLANLPRTRPGRTSPRRAAARASTGGGASPEGESAAPAKRPSTRRSQAAGATPARKRASRPKAAPSPAGKRGKASAPRRPAGSARARQSVPRQGFESEADRARGPVQPPGGTELVTSAVEIVGELAKSGLATGERLLKDVFSRLSPS